MLVESVYDGLYDSSYTTYEYDSNGKITSETTYTQQNDDLISEVTYEYDDNGNMTKKDYKMGPDRESCEAGTFFYTYNEAGIMIATYTIVDYETNETGCSYRAK